VIAAFPNTVGEQIAFNHITATHRVVKVETGAWVVEVHVALDVRLHRRRLKPHARLLLPDANLVHQVAHDMRATWLVPTTRVWADAPGKGHGAVGIKARGRRSPRGDRRVTYPAHLVVGDRCVAIVVADENSVAIDAGDEIVVDRSALGALEKDSARPLNGVCVCVCVCMCVCMCVCVCV
jgi:hypothetical protein